MIKRQSLGLSYLPTSCSTAMQNLGISLVIAILILIMDINRVGNEILLVLLVYDQICGVENG